MGGGGAAGSCSRKAREMILVQTAEMGLKVRPSFQPSQPTPIKALPMPSGDQVFKYTVRGGQFYSNHSRLSYRPCWL